MGIYSSAGAHDLKSDESGDRENRHRCEKEAQKKKRSVTIIPDWKIFGKGAGNRIGECKAGI